LAELTDDGRSLAERASAILNREVFEQVGLDADDTTALVGILRKMRRAAGDFA
jgi:8-oxo-dGTP pyrophosphatase MutT (NUDIX family)